MNKLELKHLAPYLPYGLKYIIKEAESNNKFIMRTENIMSLVKNDGNDEFPKGTRQPILRPLSDLTREVDWGNRKTCVLDIWFEIDDAARHDWEVFKKLPDYWESVIKNIELNGFNRMDWGFLNILFEWHFDVFGLIEKGLAIDKNTL